MKGEHHGLVIDLQSPDIILSDLNMPGMSGFELLMEVRNLFPAIKVIAMSGAFCGSEIPPGVLADAFYQKGSSVSMLLQILRALPHMKCRSSEHPVSVRPSPFGGMQASLSLTGA
jgi:CheY-like chemotaxis protein